MLGTQEASALNTNIPALAATIKANYMHHTSQVLEQLYNTQRALSFWSLSLGTADFGQLRDAGFPSPGLAARLKSMNDDIAADLVRAVDAFGMGRLTFGSTSENPDGEPVRIQLSEYQLKALKTPPQRSATEYAVSIPVATASKDTSRETSPFAMDGYDIRVSKVRVYLEGVQTADNDVRVVMQHLGTETIVTPTNDLMPFKHDRLHLAFHYNSSTSKILTDGDIGQDDEEKKHKSQALQGQHVDPPRLHVRRGTHRQSSADCRPSQNGKQWHPTRKAFRPTAGQTSYAKRATKTAQQAEVKKLETEMKAEKEEERQRRIQAIKDKRAARGEKERFEKMAEKMHAKRVERLRRREKRNKLLKS
ncbi:rRNA-processing protein cgr1 [Friedmanniomyces endolithicus]|nr:rRNA-processing protein cgr1 [Friedmanniomyces endolithicus]